MTDLEPAADNLTTLESHILSEETRHPGATGAFSWILSAMTLSAKIIASKIRRARIEDVLGTLGSKNITGDTQQKLDVIANETLLRALGTRAGVAVLASEENEQPIILQTKVDRPYCVLFDPLDGSSNLDACASVGTIFSILRHDTQADPIEISILQPGTKQIAAGYMLYGSSCVFVLTTGHGVNLFVLDPAVGAFILVQENLRVPESAKSYSINEAYRADFPAGYQRYLDWVHGQRYSSRYIGTMVADIHRILVQGGVFMYPPTKAHPQGKLRLMYEANPMAMIVEQAGGKAVAGTQRILDIQPTGLHERTPVIMGSAAEVDHVLRHVKAAGAE
ncbi:MAG: class 1 fructose-bisphosphatase [Planctomycetota bacterium]|nr:class 1 fructose-bisphosphatase [Planctomycetota bacterium]